MKDFLIIMFITVVIPIVAYFCIKFGFLAIYNAKKYIEKDKQKSNHG